MKKFIICLLCVLIIPACLLFSGCGVEKTKGYSRENNNRFCYVKEYKIHGEGSFYILVDKETKVMYLCQDNPYQYGMTVLLDSDGKPMLYEGEI